MRILPWKLPVLPAEGERTKPMREYYHCRGNARVLPEWWTWEPGNIWDFIIGNMYVYQGELTPGEIAEAKGDDSEQAEFNARKSRSWAIAIDAVNAKARKNRRNEVE